MARSNLKRLFSKIEDTLTGPAAQSSNEASSFPQSVLKITEAVLIHLHKKHADKPDTNTVFSPFSVAIAMTMLAGAADEDTAKSLFRKLGIEDAAQREVISSLMHSASDSTAFGIGNAVFADKTVELYDEYKTYLRTLNAEIFQVPVLADSVAVVNDWISTNTQGMIKDMLAAQALEQAHVVLVNAISFKQGWETTFDAKKTQERLFYVRENDARRVQMMHHHKKFVEFAETSKYEAVKLAYSPPANEPSLQTSMVAYLPSSKSSIEDVLKSVVKDFSKDIFKPKKLDILGIPQFEILHSFSVKTTMTELGYLGTGSFPKMCPGPSLVNEIVHKAYIKVDEKGTTAAAATAVVLTRSRKQHLNVLYLDRPFVFTIVKHNPDTVLFAGIYGGPPDQGA